MKVEIGSGWARGKHLANEGSGVSLSLRKALGHLPASLWELACLISSGQGWRGGPAALGQRRGGRV